MWGNNFTGIDDNVTELGLEQFSDAGGRSAETEQRAHCDVRQAVPDGGSGDWEGPAADGRQLHGRHQQTIGPSRAEGTSTRQIGDTNQFSSI